jgi:hypothetical protein
LDEKCKKPEEIISYTRKKANKEWFDEECAKRNEEKKPFGMHT